MADNYFSKIRNVINNSGVSSVWNSDVQNEVGMLPSVVSSEDREGRLDLTSFPFVTIDGETAQDFDDAVCVEPHAEGWILYVAIADVSHYVKPGSALDIEARRRENSIYFQDFMLPMLHEQLSTQICSLNPGEDRLCIVCRMFIDKCGIMKSYAFSPAVIRSHARLTYEEVHDMLTGKRDAVDRFHDVYPNVYRLYEMYEKMHESTVIRRPIDFTHSERVMTFNSNRTAVSDIHIKSHYESHGIIEECMIVANIAAAKFIEDHVKPLIFRIEENPDSNKISDFRKMIGSLSLELKGNYSPSVSDVAEFVRSLKGKSYEDCIQKLFLRQQKKAVYSVENRKHYLLNLNEYTHFTSPIRRYVDLVIHRIIKQCLEDDCRKSSAMVKPTSLENAKPVEFSVGKTFIDGLFRLFKGGSVSYENNCSNAHVGGISGLTSKIQFSGAKSYSTAELEAIVCESNKSEENAILMAREVDKWINASFMADKLNHVFQGTVIATKNFGLFVNIPEFDIDIFVYIGSLGTERFNFSESDYVIIGSLSCTRYYIGMNVSVRITNVNVPEGKVQGVIVK